MLLLLDVGASGHHDTVCDGEGCQREDEAVLVCAFGYGDDDAEDDTEESCALAEIEFAHVVVGGHAGHQVLRFTDPVRGGCEPCWINGRSSALGLSLVVDLAPFTCELVDFAIVFAGVCGGVEEFGTKCGRDDVDDLAGVADENLHLVFGCGPEW